jgi:acyl-CoA thioesterase I
MKTAAIITITAIAGMSISFIACSLFRKTTGKPEEVVQKVAWGEKILLHMHPEKVLNYLPDLKDAQIAYLYGMTLDEYLSAKESYDNEAKSVAATLLKDDLFARKVDLLPFKKEETILVLGESTADALNSWVYILKYLLEMRRPQDQIKVINAAVSGQTTTEALKKITTQLKQNPDWILCHLGANDCMRYGSELNKTNVSIAETLSNLNTIQNIVSEESEARIIWMAPNPVNEDKAANFPPFKQLKLTLKNADLMTLADSLLWKDPQTIDFRKDFGIPANARLMQFDGGHLSIEGQEMFVRRIVSNLSEKTQ